MIWGLFVFGDVYGGRTATWVYGQGSGRSSMSATFPAPVGVTEPRYIFGPLTQAHPPAGVLRSLVTWYLPLGASLEAADGAQERCRVLDR